MLKKVFQNENLEETIQDEARDDKKKDKESGNEILMIPNIICHHYIIKIVVHSFTIFEFK